MASLTLPPWLGVPLRQFSWRRPAGLAATLIFHIVLMWVLLTYAVLAPLSGKGEGDSGKTLSLFDLPEAAASNEDSAAADETVAVQPSQMAALPAPELPAETAVPDPPEWSMSRIRVPRPVQSSAQAMTVANSGRPVRSSSLPGGGTASPGGTDIYDPYAGAAPMRREDKMASSPSPSGLIERFLGAVGLGQQADAPELNERVLEQARADMRRRFPGQHGSVALTVRISPTGLAMEIHVRNRTLSDEAMEFLKARLIGRPLFSGTSPSNGPQMIDLPMITI